MHPGNSPSSPPYPWAGTTIERLEFYLRQDMRASKEIYDYAVLFVSRLGDSLQESHFILVKEGRKPFFPTVDLSRDAIDLANDLVDEEHWRSGEENISIVYTYEPASDRLIHTARSGESAKHFRVGPHNIFSLAEEVHPT